MSTLVVRDRPAISIAIASIRDQVAVILGRLGDATDAELLEATVRVRLAREWAKTQSIAAEVRRDLIRIEVFCLARIGRANSANILPVQSRAAARHFATFTDTELEALLDEFDAASTAAVLYQRICDQRRAQAQERDGKEWAERPRHRVADEDSIDLNVEAIRSALALLMENFQVGGDEFSVEEFADTLMEDLGLDSHFAVGVRDVCRRALRSNPIELKGGLAAPRFITCKSPDGKWLRVPFANATVGQLRSFVAMREEQVRVDRQALERLRELAATWDGRHPSERLVSERTQEPAA